jgi:nitroreductase
VNTIDELLTTTRSVRRRLDLDRPVPDELLLECVRISQQAPTGSDLQGWRWLLVTDPERKAALAELYRRGTERYLSEHAMPIDLDDKATRIKRSSDHLADNLHRVPVLAVPCIKGRVEGRANIDAAILYGSIFPAVWSFMLAARARRLGTSLTTSHLYFEREAGELLGIPSGVTQVGLVPVAFYTGDTFRPVDRPPAAWITSWDQWGEKR